MLVVLGLETSCDEPGVALYDTQRGLLSEALYSQVAVHAEYGGVVPELASRDHIRKTLPLIDRVLSDACLDKTDIHAVVLTRRAPGCSERLLWALPSLDLLPRDWGCPHWAFITWKGI